MAKITFSQLKLNPPEHNLPAREKFIIRKTAAFWDKVKVACCLLYWSPFYMRNWLHSNGSKWQIMILLTDDWQLQDKKTRRWNSHPKCLSTGSHLFPSLTLQFFHPFPKQRACSQATSMLASYTSPVEVELFFSIQTLSFVTINLHGCWPREYMCSIH